MIIVRVYYLHYNYSMSTPLPTNFSNFPVESLVNRGDPSLEVLTGLGIVLSTGDKSYSFQGQDEDLQSKRTLLFTRTRLHSRPHVHLILLRSLFPLFVFYK